MSDDERRCRCGCGLPVGEHYGQEQIFASNACRERDRRRRQLEEQEAVRQGTLTLVRHAALASPEIAHEWVDRCERLLKGSVVYVEHEVDGNQRSFELVDNVTGEAEWSGWA